MDSTTSNKLLSEIKPQVVSLNYKDYDGIDAIRKKLEMYIGKIFGMASHYKDILKKISLSPSISFGGMSESVYHESWESGKKKIINLIDTMLEDISLTELDKSVNNETPVTVEKAKLAVAAAKNEVFIVHGHDETAKTKTARFIEKLGFKPIILHEQASGSKTVIEKIEAYSNVGFGVVLYTPCDIGAKKEDNPSMQNRARQNVVFEHGFLIGKIGRENVCALVKGDIETPNDISGVVYVKMDEEDAWHLKLARELRASGYDVNMNKL